MFIGSSSKGEDKDIEIAYEHSINKNCSEEVKIEWMRQSDDPTSYWGCWQTHTWPTPFSGFRWGIAEFCNFEGRAIYTDCDMINFRDIADLYKVDLKGKPFGMVWDAFMDNGKPGKKAGRERGWYCDSVMLIDCEKAEPVMDSINKMQCWSQANSDAYKWHFIKKLGAPYREKSADLIHPLNALWNVFDGARPDIEPRDKSGDFWQKEQIELKNIWQLHLTGLSYQPWHPRYNTHLKATHWRQDLMEVWWDYAKIVSNINNPHEV